MKRLLSFCVALLATTCLWAQNNVITYTAIAKLSETTDPYSSGLHADAFNVSITSHTFSNGTGVITFSGDVTKFGEYAFRDCLGMTSILIPNSVTSIVRWAFLNCSGLTSITIPSSVTSIENNAFLSCSGLTSITVESGNTIYDSRQNCNAINETATNTLILGCQNTLIPNSITTIGGAAFYNCIGLTSVTIPNSVTSIEEGAFMGCTGLTSITIPPLVTTIGLSAFEDCSGLASVSIPNSVTSVGSHAFYNCTNLTSAGPIGSGSSYEFGWVDDIPDDAFAGCSGLNSIIIPNSVTSIGDRVFYNCSELTSITIPNSVSKFGDYAFYGCSGLTSFTIPNSVTTIGNWVFYNCLGLTSITCEAVNPPTIGYNMHNSSRYNIPLYVPAGSLTAYQNAQYWSNFTNIQEIGCEPEEYRRDVTSGNYGTICLPKGVAHENIQGGVFYNIVYAVTNTNMDITGILMEEETGNLVAGKPYIFRATADELVLPYTGAAVAEPIAANGLVGNLSETPLDVPQGMYVLSNNQIRKLAGGTATAGQNRAYIDLTNVTKLNYVPAAAPNHVMLNTEDYEITDLENIKSEDVQKIIRDGQLLIIRDGKTYNVLGNSL